MNNGNHTGIVVGIILTTLALIVGANIGIGYYMRHAKVVDMYYIFSDTCPNPVVLQLDIVNGELVTNEADVPETEYHGPTHWEGWKKAPFEESSVNTTLWAIDIALIGAGIFAYILLLTFEEGNAGKLLKMSGLFVAYVVLAGGVVLGIYNYFLHKTYTVENHLNAPIIYLYDDQSREVTVKLDVNGTLTHTYPSYDADAGWTVKTSPDGTLTDGNGRQYEYLFWEADAAMPIDFRTGFCIKGEDTADFLEKALSELGLSDTEANTFIMYWLPQMEENPYNVIAFQTTTYEDTVVLDVDPAPDTVIRVNMAYFEISEYVEMVPQDLTSMNPSLQEREGLTLVEWGGEEIADAV